MSESCYSQYKACVKKCQPAKGNDFRLCIADCAVDFLLCYLPNLSTSSIVELLEAIEVLEGLNAWTEEMLLITRARSDAMLSQQTVVKPGGVTEQFLPNVKLRQRLRVSGIDQEVTNQVITEVSKEFKDGQSSESIREKTLLKLETFDPAFAQRFLGNNHV